MPKRKPNVKRRPSGRIAYEPASSDHGTPELQARRLAALGADAVTLPLSHASPVDILTARGFLGVEQNQAARAYQRAHRIVYGRSSAPAIAIGLPQGAELSTRARLLAQRQLDAWTAILRRSQTRTNAFSRYVIDEYTDRAILAVANGTRAIALPQDDIRRLNDLFIALTALAVAPHVNLTADEIDRAEIMEIIEGLGLAA